MYIPKPQGALQGPVTRWIATPNPHSATAAPVVYEQAYGVANINRHKQPRQHGRRGKRRMSPCMCRTLAILGIFCVFLTGVAIVVSLLVTDLGDESTIALQIDATKMSVPYFEETNREKFRYYENSFCSDISTIIENSYEKVEASVESCELKEIERFLPPVYTEEFNVTGTSFTVFVVFTTTEKRPESALNAIIDLLIQGASDGMYLGYPLPCFSQIDKISFPGFRDKEIVFRKDYCFNVELTNRTLEHNSKLSVDDPAKFLYYQTQYCNDMRRLFKLSELSHSVQLDHCSLNGTESYIEQGLWPPGTTFVLWIQVRRVDVVTKTLLLYRLNQLLSKSLLYNSIEHRPAFVNITSGQIIKCRRPRPPLRTTTVAPTTPTTAGDDCNDTEITVPATEIVGIFLINLDIDTGTGYGSGSNSTVVEQKIKEIPYIRDIFEKCKAELNCIHPPEVYIISLGDPLGQELKFSIKITVVISVKESPSEVAIIVASNVPRGYTRSVKRVTITVLDCDILSCETFHGGCAHACSTHECNQLLGEEFSCSCPTDQVLVGEDCIDLTDAFPCIFVFDSCLFEITSGQEVHFGGYIIPDQETDEELVLSLDVTVTKPVCLAIGYTFDTTCPEDNWISLENCWGYRYWNATYGFENIDHVDIPKGANNLIFRLRSLGPFIGIAFVDVTEGPCRRVRLVGGENEKEGVLEFNQDNTWHPVCQTDDLRAFLPNLCYHLGFEKKWEVAVDADQFGERPPSETYVSSLRCNPFPNQCSTASIVSCIADVVNDCPDGLQALRCADMAEETIRAIRVLEGFNTQDGRIEVFNRGTWHSIAAESYHQTFDLNAETGGICRTLGYEPAFFYDSLFLPGYGGSVPDTSRVEYWEIRPPVKYGIQCVCGAESLTECKLYEWDPFIFADPLAVWCNPPIIPPVQQKLSTNQIQLVGSSDGLTAGLLELEIGGVIGTVCYSERVVSFYEEAQAAANVLCRTLGYGDTGVVVISQWGFGTRAGYAPNYLEDLRCTGDEAHINECSCAFLASSDCSHKQDAALACGDAVDTVLNQVEARLVDEKQVANGGVLGLVEVRRLDFDTETWSEWGTVCDDGISYQEVGVICNMLGYSGGGELVLNQYCGSGTGDIHVDNLDCPFNSTYLTQCVASPWGETNCRHHEDLCVCCTNEPISVRLERDPPNTLNPSEVSGLVVVRYGGRDGLITDDNTFTGGDTTDFLCSITLGIPRAEIAFSYAFCFFHFEGVNEYRARLLHNLECPDDAAELEDCQHQGWGSQGSDPDDTMHLFCFKVFPNSLPRVIGPRDGHGNVIVQVGRDNGVICSDSFTNTEAQRVCQDLGWLYGEAMMGIRGHEVTVIKDVSCQNNPTNLSSCEYTLSEDKPFCDAKRTAAVLCGNDANNLVEVTNEDGKVMVNVNGLASGSVCVCGKSDSTDSLISHLCSGGEGMITSTKAKSGSKPSRCMAQVGKVRCHSGNCIITHAGTGDTKCSEARVVCAGEGRAAVGSDNSGTTTPRDARITPGSDGTLSVDCTFENDCTPGSFINIDGTLTATGFPATVFLDYDLPYETCACVNVSKADRGSLLIVQSTTFSYTTIYTFQPFGNYAESAVIHGEPTVGYEEVCTTVQSFERPVLTGGFQSVDIYGIPVIGDTITIEDFKLYNGSCATPTVPLGMQKCRSNNQFVATSSLCDGFQDCLDGSDEKDCSAVGGFADFDTAPSDWTDTSTQDVYWERWTGPTLTLDTGPNFAYEHGINSLVYPFLATPELHSGLLFPTSPRGYLVMQAFRGNPSDQAIYEYSVPASSGEGCLSFQYALIGQDIAHLRVEVVSGGEASEVWRFSGPSSLANEDPYFQWRLALVTITDNVESVRIIAIRGLTGNSDIAIDSLIINFNGSCTPRNCLAGLEFQCHDGTCIPAQFQFDSFAHCADGSDLFFPPTVNNCLKSEFTCSDGSCVSGNFVCDFITDCFPLAEDENGCSAVTGDCMAAHNLCDKILHCADGADEVGCTYDVLSGPYCPDSQFGLATGECVPWSQRCNGFIETYDFSDEYDCPACPDWRGKCGPYCIDDAYICDGVNHCPDDEQAGCELTSNHFLCDNDTLLVIGRWLCDFFFDCADGTDEPFDCTCGLPALYFECDGRCFPNFYKCDNFQHCSNNSDEADCNGVCTAGSCACTASGMACADGSKCIPIGSRCDGTYDCDDCSDEADCDSYQCNAHYQFPCNDGTCIPATYQNDRRADCPSGEDEECSKQFKLCANGLACYPKYWDCDGIIDCDDLSDEACCSCDASQFRCHNGLCISESYRCDGFNDCIDLSDEFDCQAEFGSCRPFQWKCLSADYGVTGCVPENAVCDRVHNCLDQSDELFCLKDYQLPIDQCELQTSDRCDGVEQCEASPANNDETFCFSIDGGIVKVNGLPVCIENWDEPWMRYVCTESGLGWYGATTEREDPSSYAQFILLPPSAGLPNNNLLANFASSNLGCASDPAIVKVNCPAVNCGRRSTSVGGQWDATNHGILTHTARSGEVPWLVSVFYNRRLSCSGTILNQCWVSTAGHCVDGRVASKMEVVLGLNRLQGTHYKVARIILHPDYQASFVDHALLQLAECLTFDSYVAPLCLPHPEQQFLGEYCESAGFGRIGLFASIPTDAQVLHLRTLPDEHCFENPLVGQFYDPEIDLCMGNEDGWASSCNGDSGGPTYCSTKKDPQHFVLAGTVSYGSFCNGISVKARVSYAVEWMIEQMETYQCTCSEGCDPWSFYSTP